MSWQKRIDAKLAARRAAKTVRTRTIVENGSGRFLYYNGKKFYNFSSNNYLGLSQHPMVIQAWQKGAERYGVGSGGSGHVIGYSPIHCRLEEVLSEWLEYQRALLFISGFSANQALISAMITGNDLIIADRLTHASLLEAASFKTGCLHRFFHNDVRHLKEILDKSCSGQRLVVTEGIFSMDGNAAPLREIITTARSKNAWTLVDDAHGIGVFGDQGRGSSSVYNVYPELLVITFGKGIGISGAAVLCSTTVAEYLLQFARHLIYSTNMPPAQAAAVLAAIQVIRGDEGKIRRQRLIERIQQFRTGAATLRYQIADSQSPIQPLIVGDNTRTFRLSESLRNFGIWTKPIYPPTVPNGTARLRLTITAEHESQDIEILLEALHCVGK